MGQCLTLGPLTMWVFLPNYFWIDENSLILIKWKWTKQSMPEQNRINKLSFLWLEFLELFICVPMSIALVVNEIWRVLIRGPLQDSWLTLLTVKGERPLERSEGFVILPGLVRVLLPLAKSAQSGRLRSTGPGSLDSGENLDLKFEISFLTRTNSLPTNNYRSIFS